MSYIYRLVRIQILNAWFVVAASLLGVLALSSTAQAAVDSGSLLQQIEKGQQQILPGKIRQIKPSEPAPLQAPGGLSVTVTSFRFAGNTLMSAERLAPAVAPYLNRPLDLTELKKAAAAVAETYRQAGWVVRAYLPQQEIKDGSVTIQIVEAIFAGVVLEGVQPRRYPSSKAVDRIESAQAKGTHLNADAIDRALLLIDDLPGVTAVGNMRPGQNKSETELALKLGDEPLLQGEWLADNTGSHATGPNRLSVNLNLNSPFKQGDLTSANVMHSQGSDYLRLGETFPVGSNGWRAGINASDLKYQLIAPEFAALNGWGTSDSIGLETSYPIIRTRTKNLYFSSSIDRKNFDNQALGATTTHYNDTPLTLGISGNLFDNSWGGGANSASLMLTDGVLNLNGSPNQAADALTTQTDGHYDKLRFALSRQQVITENWSFYSALSGQLASKNLDSSEKFYLGGSSGVRAYPTSEGGGSAGQLINLELRRKLPYGFTLTGFYDFGQITINQNNDFAAAGTLNNYSLKGTGLSLAWQLGNASVTTTYSRRLGDNPNPTATGNDQDGTFVRDRVWVVFTFPLSINGSVAASAADNMNATATPAQVIEATNKELAPAVIANTAENAHAAESGNAAQAVAQRNDAALTNAAANIVPPVQTIAASNSVPPVQAHRTPLLIRLYFKTNSAKLTPSMEVQLSEFMKVALTNQDDHIAVSGHTDNRWPKIASFNMTLSQRRADAVKKYLIKNGVADNRITTTAYGRTKQVASNATQQGRAQNRRTEVELIASPLTTK
jgi:hemolysin activation/secretion protein/outer membrane protein OmpA-like peptidoglycan-associated protein